jgi:YesN/AraC family two-component response regulator
MDPKTEKLFIEATISKFESFQLEIVACHQVLDYLQRTMSIPVEEMLLKARNSEDVKQVVGAFYETLRQTSFETIDEAARNEQFQKMLARWNPKEPPN